MGWWSGDDVAWDFAGVNSGTLVHGTTFGPGVVGRAFNLDGVSNYVEISSSSALKLTNAITLEAWVMLRSKNVYPIPMIAAKGLDINAAAADWALAYSSNAPSSWRLRPWANINGNVTFFDGQAVLTTGNWYHVAMTYDGSALKGYVNGQLDGATNVSGPIQTSDHSLKLGAYSPVNGNNTYTKAFFPGYIDELTVYNRALSPTEIQGIANAGSAGKCRAETEPHGLGIERTSEDEVSLHLTGGASSEARPFYDLHGVERSTNMVDWLPWVLACSTNAGKGQTLKDTPLLPNAFYRAPTNAQITAYPQPTGPYAVGTIARLVTDPSRTNRWEATNSSFMIQVWYPAQPEFTAMRAPMDDADVIHDMPPQLLGMALPDWMKDLASTMVCHAVSDAAADTNGVPRPVVLYSPGGTFNRRQPGPMAEDLASWGYIVVSIDHFDCFGTVFPDGRHYSAGLTIPNLETNVCPYVQGRMVDIQFVLSKLDGLNTSDPVLSGQMDLGNIAAMGFSIGGGAAGETCRTNNSVKALVLFDSYLQCADALIASGWGKPLISFSSQTNRALYDKATHDAYWMQMRDSLHLHFADEQAALLFPVAQVREMSRALRGCTRSFLDKYLRGIDDHLLDNPTNAFPGTITTNLNKN